jgi:nitrogenase molybdenum-cofactor synthesis protein NifE
MGVLLLKQASRILSTYTADVMGVPSALYEMGGLVIMHDASGCNSTYNTHDEPRWYTKSSMVYISALTEMDAVLGNDEKLINDAVTAAKELQPRFIAIVGTIIPTIMGTDLQGISRVIENRTGIPTFGFKTNSMHSYVYGVNMALSAIAKRFCDLSIRPELADNGKKASINLIGATPLDFSITGNVEAMKKIFEDKGFSVKSCWAMGSSWEELMNAGRANVNVVISSCGLQLAETLREMYGTPYVFGVPVGKSLTEDIFSAVEKAFATGQNQPLPDSSELHKNGKKKVYIIGEAVISASIRCALECDYGIGNVHVICPLEADAGVLREDDLLSPYEEDIFTRLEDADVLIADPLCKPALSSANSKFISFPHEGCSGRIYRKDIPVYIGDRFNKWIESELSL